MQKKVDSFISVLEDFCPIIPILPALTIMNVGLRRMRKVIYENAIGDLDKKGLLNYLVSDRLLIESLSYEEIKDYYKYFRQLYKTRKYNNIKPYLLFWKAKKEDKHVRKNRQIYR